MKLAIIGSRTFDNYKLLKEELQPYKDKITLVISGGAKGADSLGESWAKENNIPTQIFLPDWSKGKGAGFERNKDIIKNCDVCIAFWDMKSRGTAHSIGLCKLQNKPYKIIEI